MSVHTVGNPNDYGGDDNPPEHGRDTAVFQELQPIRERLDKWLLDNRQDLPNDELQAKAEQVVSLLTEISDELNQPF